MLNVYGFSRVNPIAHGNTRDLRVLWALEEMQHPYTLVGMDHPAGDLDSEAYRALSPFAQIPAIDDDGLVLSESGAIVLHLARKTGLLIPHDADGRAQVERWCFVALNTVEMPLLHLQMIDFGKRDPATFAYRDFVLGWARRHFGALEQWLEDREFIASPEFSVADILMSHVLTQSEDAALWESHQRVRDYRERCLSRPAWRRTLTRYCERVEAG